MHSTPAAPRLAQGNCPTHTKAALGLFRALSNKRPTVAWVPQVHHHCTAGNDRVYIQLLKVVFHFVKTSLGFSKQYNWHVLSHSSLSSDIRRCSSHSWASNELQVKKGSCRSAMANLQHMCHSGQAEPSPWAPKPSHLSEGLTDYQYAHNSKDHINYAKACQMQTCTFQ